MTNQYTELYDEVRPLLERQSCEALNSVREETMNTFRRLGLPTRKAERYRYTDVEKAFAPNYGLSLAPLTIKGTPFVYAMKDAPIDVTPYYNKVVDSAVKADGTATTMKELRGEYREDALTALNTALAHDALLIHVPRNTRAKQPIRIENILSGEQDTMIVRRVLIVMEECAEATVFFVDHANSDHNFLTLQVIEVVAKDGAHLDLYELEETHAGCNRFSNMYIKAGRDCSIRHNGMTMANGVTRNGIDVYLQGQNSEVTLNGAVIADGSQHVDNNTLIDHQVPQCASSELYKYVIDDNAVGAFAGKIMVREDAQQTVSQETNNNMCAASTARMYTQPMLEIYADDVKCAHGSTVGVMDEAALFYMRQRGIPVETARTLLKTAFISQVVDEMRWEAFRDRLHILVDKRLSREERCGSCRICK
ncbi:MAG: Fe-S cluster assembly protein SufD [Prevotellaceae bacterium]|nr:Fe-S cluster assembly protein SufD [Prevotellaceae bacterium]